LLHTHLWLAESFAQKLVEVATYRGSAFRAALGSSDLRDREAGGDSDQGLELVLVSERESLAERVGEVEAYRNVARIGRSLRGRMLERVPILLGRITYDLKPNEPRPVSMIDLEADVLARPWRDGA
jgi:hypothetical protein